LPFPLGRASSSRTRRDGEMLSRRRPGLL